MPPIEGLTLTDVQYRHFANLYALAFTDDWPADRSPVKLDQPELDDVPVADQPAAMNRAAMDFAVGGPFFPGVEIGSLAAEDSSWVAVSVRDEKAAFRIAEDVRAGDLTQSLAVPWQTAFNQHYYRTDDPATAADNLWPSARPVRVPAKRGGTSDDVMWTRPFTQRTGPNNFEKQKMPRNSQMIENLSKLGFLVPATFYVEADRPLTEGGPLSM